MPPDLLCGLIYIELRAVLNHIDHHFNWGGAVGDALTWETVSIVNRFDIKCIAFFCPKNGTKIRPVQNFYFCGGTPWVWHLAPRKPPASRHPRTHKTQKLTFSHPYRFFHFHRILIDDIATGPPWLATSPVVAIGRIIMKTSLRLWIIVKNWFCLLESMSLENIGGPRACVCTQSIYGPFFGTKNKTSLRKQRKYFLSQKTGHKWGEVHHRWGDWISRPRCWWSKTTNLFKLWLL